MVAIAVRIGGVVALALIVAVVLWAPWRASSTDIILTQAENGIAGDPLAFDGNAPHELIRYEMPPPREIPPLAEGTADLGWADLWLNGTYEPPQLRERDRVGIPSMSEFPDGTTTRDIEMFFLDIADMRSLQPMEGAVNDDLDGKRVRLSGYTTPVSFGEDDRAFLLVPVLGACIHVPPPPPNQIVYVPEMEGDAQMFAPVWVEGTLRADPTATVLADAGYRLEDARVTAYR